VLRIAYEVKALPSINQKPGSPDMVSGLIVLGDEHSANHGPSCDLFALRHRRRDSGHNAIGLITRATLLQSIADAPRYGQFSEIDASAPPPDVALVLPTLYSGGARARASQSAAYFIARACASTLWWESTRSLKDKVPPGVRVISLDARRVLLCLPQYSALSRGGRGLRSS